MRHSGGPGIASHHPLSGAAQNEVHEAVWYIWEWSKDEDYFLLQFNVYIWVGICGVSLRTNYGEFLNLPYLVHVTILAVLFADAPVGGDGDDLIKLR